MLTRSSHYALAAASGILLALSFPKYGHPAFGWIALAPLLVALSASTAGRFSTSEARIPIAASRSALHAFTLGLTAGVVYFTGTLYWIARVMVIYGDLQWWVAALINAALIVYLALFPALFAVVMRRLVLAFGDAALMASPVVWVASELGRTHLLSGFPWVLLGYSQIPVLPIAQLASIVGVYGVSALVTGVSAVAAMFAVERRSLSGGGPGTANGLQLLGRAPWRAAAGVGALLLVVAVWGSVRVSRGDLTRTGNPIRVGLIQGNVDQAEKTDPARAQVIFDDHLRMTRQVIGGGAELVVWPESSTPFFFEEYRTGADRIRAIAREAHVPILIGSDQIEWRSENGRQVPVQYFNAAFLVRADGTTAGVYRKMHLVPFGEYVPLRRLLFFAAPLVESIGVGFGAGDNATVLPIGAHTISVAICYEVVYPDLVRRFVRGGSELLSTITNDAWFGPTSAPYQHFEQASMRAIEEGRYLIRSANTGVSGIVDPYGRVLARSGIYQQTVILGEARFLDVSTLYARYGDVFAYASVVITLAMLLTARRRVK